MPKPVRPFPLISYYREPSIGFRWKGTRYGIRHYSADEFVDKLYAQGVKPSAALRAYDSCKETNLWMQDELYLSGWEIEEISKTLTKYGDEVNTLVEKAASERAARYAYDHPKLPKGFVTIEQLQGMGLMVTPRKRMPRKRTIEMRSRL